jgi:hypothetical protein
MDHKFPMELVTQLSGDNDERKFAGDFSKEMKRCHGTIRERFAERKTDNVRKRDIWHSCYAVTYIGRA